MAALLIVIVLATGFIMYIMGSRTRNTKRIQRGRDRAKRMNNPRDIMTGAQYLAHLRIQAKQLRCGEMSRPGTRSCRRAAGRPCVSGCRGRTDIDTDWKG